MKLSNDEIKELALKIKCLLPSSNDTTIDEISSKIIEVSKRRRTKDTIFKEVYGFFKTKPVEYSTTDIGIPISKMIGETDHPVPDGDTNMPLNINEDFVKNLLGIDPDDDSIKFHIIQDEEQLKEAFEEMMNAADGDSPTIIGAAVPMKHDTTKKLDEMLEELKASPQYKLFQRAGMSDDAIKEMIEKSIKDNEARVADVNKMKEYFSRLIMNDMNLIEKTYNAFKLMHKDIPWFLDAFKEFCNKGLRESIPDYINLTPEELDETDYIANMVFIAIHRAMEIGFDIGQTLLDQLSSNKPNADIPMPIMITTPISCTLTYMHKENIEKYGKYRMQRVIETLRRHGVVTNSDDDNPYIDILTPYIKARINDDDFSGFAYFMQSLTNKLTMAMVEMARSEDFR